MRGRRRATALSAALLFLLALPFSAQQENAAAPAPDPMRAAMDAAVARVKPALVRIFAVMYEFNDGREYRFEIAGSGVIITPEGHAVTNHHVAGSTRRLFVTLSDRRELEAELVGTDALSDIAVIKIKGEPGEKFPTASFGDSSLLRVGDPVLAMGSPLALSQSVTKGIVSNTEMVIPRFRSFSKIMMDGEDVGTLVRWLAHDAPIYGGNSGGPLVNMRGEVVGINEIKLGLSGAIPGNLAREVAEALMREGSVRRSWLGLELQPLLKDSPRPRGALVGGVVPGSPAEKAGFRAGDILLKLAGRETDLRFEEQQPVINQFAMGLAPGREVEALVFRDGKEKAFSIIPEEREPARGEGREMSEWGLTARNLSMQAARELRRESRDGLLVTGVRPGGPAAEAKPSLQPRDVITAVGGEPVKSLEDMESTTRKLLAGKTGPAPLLVAYERRGEQQLTVVKAGVREWQDPGLEVRKAWFPASVQVLSRDLAEALGLAGKRGVRVTRLYPGSAAEKAGFRVGDILTAMDGEEIHASQPEEADVFPAMVRQYKIGSRAEFSVLREGKEMKIAMDLPAAPPLSREMKKYYDAAFDFTARDLAFLDRMERRWEDVQRGALVEGVAQGGWAALGGLAVDDLILAVDGRPVASVEELDALMHEASRAKKPRLVLQVLRGISTKYLELQPAWDDASRPGQPGRREGKP